MRGFLRLVAAFLAVLIVSPVLAPFGYEGGLSSVHAAGCPSDEVQKKWYPTPLADDAAGVEVGLQACGGWNSYWDQKYYETRTDDQDNIERIITRQQATYRSTKAGTYYYRTVKYYFVFAGENIYYAYHSDPGLGNITPGRDVVIAKNSGDNQSIGANVRELHGRASDTWDMLTRQHPDIYPDGTPKIAYELYTRDFILNNQPKAGYYLKTGQDSWTLGPGASVDQLLDQDAPYLVIAPAIMVYRTTQASKTNGIDIIGYVRPDQFQMILGSDGKPNNRAVAQSAYNYIFGPGMPGVIPNGTHTKEEVKRVFDMTAGKDYSTLFQVIPLRNPPDYSIELKPKEKTDKVGKEVEFTYTVKWKDHPKNQGFRVIFAYQTPKGKLPVDFSLDGTTATKGKDVSYVSKMTEDRKGEITGTVKVKVYDKRSTLIAQVILLDKEGKPLPIQSPYDANPSNNEDKAIVTPEGIDYVAMSYQEKVRLSIPYDVDKIQHKFSLPFTRIDQIEGTVPYTITIRDSQGGSKTLSGPGLKTYEMKYIDYTMTFTKPGTYTIDYEIWPNPKDLETKPENNKGRIIIEVNKLPKPAVPSPDSKIHIELRG